MTSNYMYSKVCYFGNLTKKLVEAYKMGNLELIIEKNLFQTRQKISFDNRFCQRSFLFENSRFFVFSDNNGFKIPDMYRLDIDVNIERNNKTIEFSPYFLMKSAYNTLGRNIFFSLFYSSQIIEVKGTKTAIPNFILPSTTDNFKF